MGSLLIKVSQMSHHKGPKNTEIDKEKSFWAEVRKSYKIIPLKLTDGVVSPFYKNLLFMISFHSTFTTFKPANRSNSG